MAGNNNLLNHAHIKKTALRMAKDLRPWWKANRVSQAFIDEMEAHMLDRVRKAIIAHPTVGKTIKMVNII